jgi:flagellar hook-associated protein 1 FlgK
MALSGAMNSGLTGLFSRQKAIEVTGNNIANVNTPGYSRQLLHLTPAPALNVDGHLIGQGVDVLDVKREHDAFLTNQLKDKCALLGEERAKSAPLSEVQRIFGIGETALANDIDTFFGSWHDLSANPDGVIERDKVLYSAENMLSSFEGMRSDLGRVKQNINDSINSKLVDINQKLDEVAELNKSIQNQEVTGIVATSDRDRRDLLVKELSGLVGCKTFQTGASGIALHLPGSGIPLVHGVNAYHLEGEYVNSDLQLSISIGQSTMDVGRSALGGELKGLLDVRDAVIPEMHSGLDKLEYNIVNAVNIQHESGFGLDGQTGRAFFTRSTSVRSETGFADPEDLAFNTGSIEITVGGESTVVSIDEGDNSLNGIRDAINAAGTGALASVVFDGSDYHLDLTPKTAGEAISIDDSLLSTEETDAEFTADFTEQADGSYQNTDTFSEPEALRFGKGTFDLTVDNDAAGPEAPVTTSITIGPGENSLRGIRDAINASDAEVSASILGDDVSGYSLSLTPDETGAEVTLTAAELANLSDSDVAFADGDPDPAKWDDLEAHERTQVVITDSEQVAAGFEPKSGDNQNALAMAALGQSDVVDNEETFVGFYGGLSSNIGIEVQRNGMALGGAQDTVTQLENRLESIVGVSLEQEMINLTLYQTGFEACSRLVTTVDELMQTVLGMKR